MYYRYFAVNPVMVKVFNHGIIIGQGETFADTW
jgi:hypothetical protein